MKTIAYNGKEYPIRVLTMSSPETGEITCTIADTTLEDAIMDSEMSDDTSVDDQIYFYVEEGKLYLSAEEICGSCLDIKFEFISEEK